MMPHPTAVLNIVALSPSLLGTNTPHLNAFLERAEMRRLRPGLPAVTTSVQSSMLTGAPVREHGIVGNGWFNREQQEIQFWKQSNRLVAGEKVWETARRRDPSATCLNMFWWYNMYSTADWSVTPRPIYKADGRKIPDCYTEPPALRDELQDELGPFPLFRFWGPAADIAATQWIADATRLAWTKLRPTLSLVYLPHLDYGLQKLGPGALEIDDHVVAIDAIAGELIQFFEANGVRVIVLSEYGIEAVDRPVAPNLALRDAGLLRARDEMGLELLDAGASRAFAVADHQLAHVYVADPEDIPRARAAVAGLDGVERVLDAKACAAHGLDHARSGELVLIAERGAWFTYDYWEDDRRAPDFARTVDIHRKPGYDPRELFFDPALPLIKAQLAWKLLRKKLGFRQLMDVIPLDAELVRGSHGRNEQPEAEQPVLMTEAGRVDGPEELPVTAVRDVILGHLFED